MRFFFLSACVIISVCLHAQTIKRWSGGKQEIKDQQLPFSIHSDIFADYGWMKPEAGSRPVDLSSGSSAFTFNGKEFKLTNEGNGDLTLEGNGTKLSATKEKTKGRYYYSKAKLKLVPVIRYRWVSHYTTTAQTLPVVRYRTVTSYQYDYASKTSRPVSRQESYVSYETRWVPKTDWRWESYTTYEYDIPEYHIYSYRLPDSTHLIVYEDSAAAGSKYYIQNASYVKATDESGTNYILTDDDMNGSYTDPTDKIVFNSWNPYQKNSSFRRLRFFKENSWFTLKYLLEEYFVDIELSGGQLTLNYANSKYNEAKGKGKVHFVNVPKNAEVLINGRNYKPRETYKSEYGVFKVTIKQKNYLDYVTTYVIDDSAKEQTVSYQVTGGAAPFTIKNIFAEDYFVTVTNASGYGRTYHNTSDINVPPGDTQIEIYTDGFTTVYDGSFKAGEPVEYDFEAEVKKLNK
jgi:hypothetical protein